ncbi:glycoside hydrolase family 2 protein [Flexithrix dorotheae]|uniref:glycoside hydrolase family 2 protein n=1 Tax=Flexithrix dorotheae TaxID=70993 RepID=UPI0003671719|nr:glycoside hydrolase family 2 [Flexithrix dorotheae]
MKLKNNLIKINLLHTYFFCLIIFQGIAQTPIPDNPAENLIINIQGRNTFSLDGKWRIIIDPMEVGYLDYRLKPNAPANSFAANAKPQNMSDRIEYDFDKSPLVNVPGDWNSQLKELEYYEGSVWYKRSFQYTKDADKRQFIYFGGVNYEANVYLNGKKLGDHIGGFTPFNFEVTDLLEDGENHLVLRVNNTRKREAVPTVNFDWWNYGGITRSVSLVALPKSFVKQYSINLKNGTLNQIEGWVQIEGASEKQKIAIEIPEAGINEKVSTDEKGYAQFSFKAKLDLWSPANPKLYEVSIKTPSETLTDKIGFRDISVDGYDILLNKKPVFLKGICIHEEAPYRFGRAFSRDEAQILLGWAKELGCNFVRLAHYPHNENMIRVADEMGIMVWAENPVYWTILWDNPDTYKNAQNQLTEVITRDRNRASVIMWSMANETPLSDSRLTFISNLAKYSKKTDPTRLVTAALEIHVPEDKPNTVMLEDPLAEYLDVYGCNEYFGWYVGTPEKADTMRWEMKYTKPLIISEFGGGALQGYFGNKKQVWTEDFQNDVYQHNIVMFNKIPFLRGTTPWLLKDFKSPKRLLPGIQDGYNRKGLISETGVKKKAFYTMKKWYDSK